MKKLIRKGHCLQCGQCCKLINLMATESNKWVRPSREILQQMEGVVCKHLYFAKGKGYCRLFGKPGRPLACILYPTSPKDLLPGCGYYFVEVECEDE